jgi:hypothetical protein
MLRQGEEPRGIIGYGTAASDWYFDRHWEPGRRGEQTTYVDVRLDRLVDVDQHPEAILGAVALTELVPGLAERIQRSGTRVDDDLAIGIEQLFRSGERLKLARDEAFPEGISKADVIEAIRYFEQNGYPPTFDG